MTRHPPFRSRLLAGVMAAVLLGAACGDDDDGTSAPPTTAPPTTTDTAPEPTEAASTSVAATTTQAPVDLGAVTLVCAPGFGEVAHAIASEHGNFEANGLETSCVQVASGPERAAALISGEAQFSGDLPNNAITLLGQGFDIVAFHEAFSAQPFDLLVDSDYPLPSANEGWEGVMRDLQGARIGVVARGAAAEDIARVLFRDAGVDADAQTYIATGVVPPTLSALAAGEIDAAITFEPGLSIATRDRMAVRPFSLQRGEGPDSLHWPGLVWTASREYVENNSDVVCAFRNSLNEAVAFMKNPDNKDEVLATVQTHMASDDPATVELIFDNNVEYLSDDGEIDPAQLDSIGQLVHDLGKADKVYRAADFVVDTNC